MSALTFSHNSFRSRVLYADADSARRSRLVRAFSADGHDVVTIVGATQLLFALQIVVDGLAPRPDAIVVDTNLGDGAGLEVLRAHREDLSFLTLALLAPRRDAEVHLGLEPCAVFAGAVDEDDLRTALLNAPINNRFRARRQGEAAPPSRRP
ncbi:MAG: hypothetical protein JNL38_27705 [Myxococcales bacterium]|jgi:CheY-like chemotaxis protein|nr:hypothetical protein [Myxococcales bacterium]